jgi:hypothetical protein
MSFGQCISLAHERKPKLTFEKDSLDAKEHSREN